MTTVPPPPAQGPADTQAVGTPSSNPSVQEKLRVEAHAHLLNFKREQPAMWWGTLIGPIAATGAIVAVLWVIHGTAWTLKMLGTAVFTFFVASRMIILGGKDVGADDIQKFFSPEFLFAMVIWMDVVAAILLVYHMGLLFKVPWLGERILALTEDGQVFLKTQPWMRRLAWLGLVTFVAVPLAATGSIGGALFGRLLGLSRIATIMAIFVGSFIGCGAIYALREVLPKGFQDNPWLFWGGIAVIVAILSLLNIRYARLKKRMRESGAIN